VQTLLGFTVINRERRLNELRRSAREYGRIKVTLREIEHDVVLRRAEKECLLEVVEPHVYQDWSSRGEVKEEELPQRARDALRELNESASEVYGEGRWTRISEGTVTAGYLTRSWKFTGENRIHNRRGGFKTLDALLDDFDEKKIEYLEWAVGQGA